MNQNNVVGLERTMSGQGTNLDQIRGEDESRKRTVRRAQAASHRRQSGSEEGGKRKS